MIMQHVKFLYSSLLQMEDLMKQQPSPSPVHRASSSSSMANSVARGAGNHAEDVPLKVSVIADENIQLRTDLRRLQQGEYM